MEHKDDTIHVRLGPELRSQLERLAALDERPLSQWVRKTLREAAREAEQSERAA